MPDSVFRSWLLLALGALVLAPGLLLGPPGAKGAGGALRVLAGEVPYRDFWTMYAPGQFYLQALLFRVFGVSWMVQGVACVVLRAASGVAFHSILRGLRIPARSALLLWAVFVAAFWRVAPQLDSYPPALLLGLLGLERTFANHREGGGGKLVVAGLAFGAAAWFKHDVAAYFALAATGSVVLRSVLSERAPAEWGRTIACVARIALGCLVTAGPAIAAVAIVAGPDAWNDLFVFPTTDFPLVRGERYPTPVLDTAPFAALFSSLSGDDLLRAWRDAGETLRAWSLTQLPVLVFLGALAAVVARRRRLAPADLAVAVALLLGLPCFYAAAHVQQNTHLDSMAICALVLLAMGRRDAGGLVRAGLGLLIALYAGSFLLEAAIRGGEFATSFGSARTLDLAVTRGVRVQARYAGPYETITHFVRDNVPEGGRIHAGVDRHDAVVGNDQNFYLLSGRLPATRYNELHPAVVDREDVQREMIADLERHEVRCVVIWNFRFGDPEQRIATRREKIPGLGADLLDRYLEREYEEVLRVGQYAVRWKKDAPAPRLP